MTTVTKPQSFNISAEATEFMYTVAAKLNSAELMSWAKFTDYNFDTTASACLKRAISAYDQFLAELESAV